MSLKTSLPDYLMTSSFIATNFSNKIYRKRITKTQTPPPYIVYWLEGYENKMGHAQGLHGAKPWRLTIDIVGPYTEDDMIEATGTEIVKMLGNFNGVMGDWKGTITQKKYEDGYDEKSDFTVVRIEFIALEIF